MATIKPIEAHSIHQIQSGQVIVDLSSVVKELVENSLDAGATSLEVRFKNNGLDSIEVQDNGSGISPSNYESLALKHYTSKLASYDDLSSLQTFGFRGEALSSMCALSKCYVITATAHEAPKGKRLDFELSGKLKNSTVVAAQRGTTVVIEGLFEQLPVRRKELMKNIKREYGKALGLLHAYACICVNVKFIVKSAIPNGKNATVFATKANPTTRENIANVYGAKTLSALMPLELELDFQRTLSQKSKATGSGNKIMVKGHISRPVFGEGRQTPDRQMFFVNGRPCGLPQISKAFNEAYKSFNVLQSPFIFADLEMDTKSYDVNVSPDKRTILLHDSASLVETLKASLAELFDQQEQTVPQSHIQTSRLPAYKQLSIAREPTADSTDSNGSNGELAPARKVSGQEEEGESASLLHGFFRNHASIRDEPKSKFSDAARWRRKERQVKTSEAGANNAPTTDEFDDLSELHDVDNLSDREEVQCPKAIRVRDFNERIAEENSKICGPRPAVNRENELPDPLSPTILTSPPQTNAIQSAFDRIRPTRPAAEMATITVGDKTITAIVGNQLRTSQSARTETPVKDTKATSAAPAATQAFTQRLKGFAAQGNSIAQTTAEIRSEADSGDENEILEPETGEMVTENISLVSSAEVGEDDETDADRGSGDAGSVQSSQDGTDGDYVGETEKKVQEDARVADLIRAAEKKARLMNSNNSRLSIRAFKDGSHKDSTTSLQVTTITSTEHIRDLIRCSHRQMEEVTAMLDDEEGGENRGSEEELLDLTVSKTDFSNMQVVGQFNLGFVLAVRTASETDAGQSNRRKSDELFIVDQHASDEKYNFERLQAETVVGNQRLVRPKQLDLTAVEEEILIENSSALEKNGFLISIDDSGDKPIGRRCSLVSLPLSKEVTFGLEDLEELIHLLAESPGVSQTSTVPRPSNVRKMFAMRACRSSIMIGKPLTASKMKAVISHMSEIDKPWNCPHGRPTMRHLMTLNSLETWQERDGMIGRPGIVEHQDVWNKYAKDKLGSN